jgi:GTP pyrophosphokinase
LSSRPTKTQIDRLGDRLKGDVSESDLRLLDDYRRSFGEAYESVVRTIRAQFGLEPTGRPAKSTSSLREKLRRESIRLSQVQDIAGCRLVVTDIAEQERVLEVLRATLSEAFVVDRRKSPSYGYRAVHIIAKVHEKSIEIQVRTALQHLWAEFSEKLSDVVDPAIKYGRSDKPIGKTLLTMSNNIEKIELIEQRVAQGRTTLGSETIVELQGLKQQMIDILRGSISKLEELRNDLSD